MQDDATARVAARVALGQALRQARYDAGLSGLEAAERLGWSQSKVSRMESARVRATVSDVRGLLKLYRAPARTVRDLVQLAETAAGADSDWRNSSRVGLTRRQQDFVALEAGAASILHFQPVLIPGPMQTDAYAERVLAMAAHPDPGRGLELRQARRAAMFRPNGPRLRVVVYESALRWDPGPPGVLREQLGVVADLVEQYDTAFHVLVLDEPQPTFLQHPVVTYHFADGSMQARIETATTDLRVTRPADVELFDRRINALTKVALNRRDSISYVRHLAERGSPRRTDGRGNKAAARRGEVAQEHHKRGRRLR